jgi:hypothetical protein
VASTTQGRGIVKDDEWGGGEGKGCGEVWYGDIDGGSHSHARYNAARCDGASGVERPRQSELLFPVQQHHGVELQARHLHTHSHPSTQHSPQQTEHTQTRSEMSQNGGTETSAVHSPR